MNIRDTLDATYANGLASLANWLRKAAAEVGEERAGELLSARLAPDMLPLATQVRFVCVQAIEGMHRLRGEIFPARVTELLDEGRKAGEAPGSMDEALARIEEAAALVARLAADAEDGDGNRDLAHDLPMGLIFDLTLEQYVRDWALPQFYFHLVTAYAILRSQGVTLGKADFVPHMFGYARPGTVPEGMG